MFIGRMMRRAAIAAGVAGSRLRCRRRRHRRSCSGTGAAATSVDGSGREVVRFSPQFAPGQIIVSFGDRRLYFVTRPGEAISYPIAIPREKTAGKA